MSETDEDLDSEFQRGTALRDEGRFDEAEAHFLQMLRRYPRNKLVLVGLATVYYFGEEWVAARDFLVDAIKVFPDSELLSVALFHSLVHLGLDEEAMREMERFLAIRPNSKEYRLIREEIVEGADA